MAEFIVAIDHMTYDAVQAEDEVTAIDLVLEGQGREMSSETRDASISEYERSEPRRHGVPSGRTGEALLEASHALVAGDGTCPAGLSSSYTIEKPEHHARGLFSL